MKRWLTGLAWLVLLTFRQTVTQAAESAVPPVPLVNVVLIEIDTSSEAVAARQFEQDGWTFWGQTAPTLLARLEGDLGQTRSSGGVGPETSLYAIRCAAKSLDDTQDLEPLTEHLDSISKLTGRPSLLVVWMANQGCVLLGLQVSQEQHATYALAALERIYQAHARQAFGDALPAVAPPCVVASGLIGEARLPRSVGLDRRLRESGIDAVLHSVALVDLQRTIENIRTDQTPQLPPGAEIQKVVFFIPGINDSGASMPEQWGETLTSSKDYVRYNIRHEGLTPLKLREEPGKTILLHGDWDPSSSPVLFKDIISDIQSGKHVFIKYDADIGTVKYMLESRDSGEAPAAISAINYLTAQTKLVSPHSETIVTDHSWGTTVALRLDFTAADGRTLIDSSINWSPRDSVEDWGTVVSANPNTHYYFGTANNDIPHDIVRPGYFTLKTPNATVVNLDSSSISLMGDRAHSQVVDADLEGTFRIQAGGETIRVLQGSEHDIWSRVLSWNQTSHSRMNDTTASTSVESQFAVPTYWTESGRTQSATEAGVLPGLVNGHKALVVGTGPEVDILYKGAVNRLGKENVLRIDAPFDEREHAFERQAKAFRADAILAVKERRLAYTAGPSPELKLSQERYPRKTTDIGKPPDIYPWWGGGDDGGGPPPPGGGGTAIPNLDRLMKSTFPLTYAMNDPTLRLSKPVSIPKPGGILFYPDLEIVADESGLTASKAEQALSAVKDKAGGEFSFEGWQYLAVKAPGTAKFFRVAAGRFHVRHQDLSVRATAGVTVELNRYYDSGSVELSPLGQGWTFMPLSLRIGPTVKTAQAGTAFAKKPVLVDNERGVEMAYQMEVADETTTSPEAVRDLPQYKPLMSSFQPYLAARSDGGYVLAYAHGLQAGFDQTGRLEWAGQSEANQVRYTFESGRLVEITGLEARILLKYDENGRSSSAVGSDGRRVEYIVDGSHGLTKVSGASDGSFTFAYGTDSRLSTIQTLAQGDDWAPIVENVYDSKGRMVSHHTPSGLWRFRYNDAAGFVVVTPPSGKDVSYYYDGKQQLVAYGSSAEDMTLFNYDVTGRIFQVAAGRLLNDTSTGERPRFKVTRMITAEI